MSERRYILGTGQTRRTALAGSLFGPDPPNCQHGIGLIERKRNGGVPEHARRLVLPLTER